MVNRAIQWKENKIISIQIKKDIFLLAQMLKIPYMIFFKYFRNENIWEDIIIKEDDILFCHAITKQFLKYSSIEQIYSINCIDDYTPPNLWIVSGDFENKIIWKDTKFERIIISRSTLNSLLVDKDIINHQNNTHRSGIFRKIIKELNNKDYELVKDYELTTLDIFPNLNERLFLCYKFGKNVDPEKEIMFDQYLPIEYLTYVDIISGNYPLEDLGYKR